MKKRVILISILTIVFLLVACLYLVNFFGIKENKTGTNISKTEIANPASKYCVENGGTLAIRTENSSGQYGICILNQSGKIIECEEWKFFRGECNLSSDECEINSDCVPASCCHPTSCVNKNSAPNCEGVACTMECKIGTLDCGYGKCNCVNKKCSATLD